MIKKIALPCRKTSRTLLISSILLCVLSSCSQMGPRFIEGSRTDYNVAMGNTESEQILLNLVRLRYGDAPYFLEATALNTQFSSPSIESSWYFVFIWSFPDFSNFFISDNVWGAPLNSSLLCTKVIFEYN